MRSPSPSPGVRELLHEKLDALLADGDKITINAAHGRTLHELDDVLFIEGPKFINAVWQQKIQERIEQIEATPESQQCPHCKKKRKRTTKRRKR